MTLIEFFDKTPLSNILGSLALRPRRVVFIGTDRRKLSDALPAIQKILRARGLKTSLSLRVMDSYDLSGILDILKDIIEYGSRVFGEDEYVFDFTGGEEAALVAVGMVFRLTDQRAHIFQISAETRQGMLYRIPLNGTGDIRLIPIDGTSDENKVELTNAEGILLHNGRIREEMVSGNTADGFPFTDSVYKDINRLWKLCIPDCGFWNQQTGRLGGSVRETEEDPSVYSYHEKGMDENFMSRLESFGMLSFQRLGGRQYCTFKNPYIKDCLTKSGTLLEYKTYMTAFHYKADNVKIPYTDAGAGVVIEWNGSDTRNEIDVMLMQGVLPYFISCKNGDIKTDELYKLHTVAGRFGNKYARRILVSTTYFDPEDRSYDGDLAVRYMRERANDMHITILDRVHRMSDREFFDALAGCAAETTVQN
ncbi:MAG: hypothetical protein IJ325_10080 [Clostridia bacterium]|nr:hypothetical protein [Clostridia bacterium]